LWVADNVIDAPQHGALAEKFVVIHLRRPDAEPGKAQYSQHPAHDIMEIYNRVGRFYRDVRQ
jgi:hypothetical protein